VTDFFAPSQPSLQVDEPFPEANTSLFEETFNFGFPRDPTATTFNDVFSNVPPHVASASQTSYDLASMDYVPPQELSLSLDCITAAQLDLAQHSVLTGAATSWATTPPMEISNSGPSSTYSGSPARSELSLPVIAPRPQHAPAGLTFDMWQDHVNASVCEGKVQGLSVALATQHLDVPSVTVAGVDVGADHQMHADLEMLFDPTYIGINTF